MIERFMPKRRVDMHFGPLKRRNKPLVLTEEARHVDMPTWFAFDEETAMKKWGEDVDHIGGEEIYTEMQATSPIEIATESEDSTPEWFSFSDGYEMLADSPAENNTETPNWFQFSENEVETIKPIISVVSPPKGANYTSVGRKRNISWSAKTTNHIYQELPQKVTPSLEPIVIIDYDTRASQGLSLIARSLDSMDYVTKAIASHMAACNGSDGHKGKMLTSTTVSRAREKALLNVMNTAIGQKLSKGEEITQEDQKNIDAIVSMTYESTLGIDTSNIRDAGVDLSDMTQVQMLMPQIMPQHIHGAGCDHGSPISGSISLSPQSLSSSSLLESVLGKSGHEHHDKLFFCDSCKKSHKLHIHSKKDAVCPACKSRNLKEVKKKHRH